MGSLAYCIETHLGKLPEYQQKEILAISEDKKKSVQDRKDEIKDRLEGWKKALEDERADVLRQVEELAPAPDLVPSEAEKGKPQPFMVRIPKLNKSVPVTEWREVKRGKNKDKIEVKYRGRKYYLDKDKVKLPEEAPEPEGFKKGDIITDGIVNGKITGEGSVKFGKKDLPAYEVEILTGHQKGEASLIPKEQAKALPEQPAAEPEIKGEEPLISEVIEKPRLKKLKEAAWQIKHNYSYLLKKPLSDAIAELKETESIVRKKAETFAPTDESQLNDVDRSYWDRFLQQTLGKRHFGEWVELQKKEKTELADKHKSIIDALEDYQAKQKPAEIKEEIKAEETAGETVVSTEKIEDFGEKLGGARKDTAQSITREISDDDIASLPLSKIWPKSDIDGIEDIRYKLNRWVEQIKTVRELMKHVDEMGAGQFLDKMADSSQLLRKLVDKINFLQEIPREHWGRIGKVENAPNAYKYDKDGKKVDSPFALSYVDKKYVSAENLEDLKSKVLGYLGEAKTGPEMQFEIRGSRNEFFINKKGDPLYRKLKTFDAVEDARKFKRENYDELVKAWENIKEKENVKETDVRRKENRPRVGADHRKGKDATPEMFMDAFGFRGVEFGNWVSQGKNVRERQGMLNAAYDALYDLADILGIPTKAISLNGTLGLGFGSRGSGWASAHYEPDALVINLTKTRGAGALAHEWFHALDNYFQRKRDAGGYITQNPETYYQHKDGTYKLSVTRFNEVEKRGGVKNPDDWKKVEGVRPEVEESFTELVKALNDSPMAKRSKLISKGQSSGYWSRIIERAARSFENYIIAKMQKRGYDNDYLANVVSIKSFARDPGRYPYLLEEELAPVESAFDNLFETLETKETEKGVELYSIAPAQEKLSSVTLKDVRRAFSGSEVKATESIICEDGERTGGFVVTLPNGRTIVIDNSRNFIVFDPDAISKEWGIPKDKLGVAKGKYRSFPPDQGLIELLQTSDPSTLSHEKFHALFDLALTARQQNRIMHRYKTQERAAEAFRRREGFTRSFWEKIQAWIDRVRNALFGDVLLPVSESTAVSQGVGPVAGGEFAMMGGKKAATAPIYTDEFKAKMKGSVVTKTGKPWQKPGDEEELFHSGSFRYEEDEQFVIEEDGGIHFGTEDAANARIGGKAVDDAISEIEVYENDDGTWGYEIEGMDYGGEFATEDEASIEAEEMAASTERFDVEDEEITSVYLSLKNPKKVSDQGADWTDAITKAKKEGYDGIIYTNQFEDKGSLSYIAFSPDQIAFSSHLETNITRAQKMLDAGKPEAEVWKETGWRKGPKGQWEFEIDDSGARFVASVFPDGTELKLSDIITHKKLYDAYPQLKDVNVLVDNSSSGASYDNISNTIRINDNLDESQILHEIQHAVQEIEGFPRGGSPETIDAGALFKDDEFYQSYTKTMDDLSWEGKDWDSPEMKAVRKSRDDYIKTMLKAKYGESYSGEIYNRLYGEIEARDTADRAALTAEQRRQQYPDFQGIPRDQWIVRDSDKGTSFSIEKPSPETMTSDQWADDILRRAGVDTKKLRKTAEATERELSESTLDAGDKMIKSGFTWNLEKPDTKKIERALSTPLHYFKKIGATWRMFRSAERKQENQSLMQSYLAQDAQGNWMTKIVHLAKKQNPVEYAKWMKRLVTNDRDQRGYKVKYSPSTGKWNLYGPSEFRKIAEADSYREARRIRTEESFKRGIDNERLFSLTKDKATGKWVISLPKKMKSLGVYATDDAAWTEARQRELDDLRAEGYSEGMVKIHAVFKQMLDRSFQVRIRNTRKMQAYYRNVGAAEPSISETIEGVKVNLTLQDYLDEMGDLRGFYFPRIRRDGKYALVGEKKGANPILEFFDLAVEPRVDEEGNIEKNEWRDWITKKLPIGRRAKELEKQGYRVSFKRSDKLPEDVYQMAGSIVAMNEKIMKALEKMDPNTLSLEDFDLSFTDRRVQAKGGVGMMRDFAVYGPLNKEQGQALKDIGGHWYSAFEGEPKGYHFPHAGKNIERQIIRALANVRPLVDKETTDLMAHHFLEELANIDKARGGRQHMIRRNQSRGADVWTGYEEDPAVAITKYIAGLAGLESKRQMGGELVRYMTGTDVSWDNYKEIKQYKSDYDKYVEHWNQKESDREGIPIIMPAPAREEFEKINDPTGYEEKQDAIKEAKEALDEARKSGDTGRMEEAAEAYADARDWLWNEYSGFVKNRRVDAAKQENAFHDAKTFMNDLLRNDESMDRVIGSLKGLAVLKYLGFRVFSAPLVNLTALGTSVPASFKIHGEIPMRTALRELPKAIKLYVNYILKPGGVSEQDRALFEDISKRGWDKAQFNREALVALESKLGKAYTDLIEWSMYVFGKSEQLNRVATITAAYKALRKRHPAMHHDQLMEKAKFISDNAHSIYHKANRPHLTRGGGFGGNLLQAAYVFKSFSHNYLLLMKDAWGSRLTPEHKAALAWLTVSPAVLAGTGALVGKEILVKLIEAFTDSDDPEEDFYKWTMENFGQTGENFVRYGAIGALTGVNLKGSLEIGITDIPTSITDLLGAPGSMIADAYWSVADIAKGRVWKGAEKLPIVPLAASNISKGIREGTEGVTTRTGSPVFFGNEPLKADLATAILRSLSFNPVRMARKREIQWHEKKVIAKYRDMRNQILEKVKKYYMDKDRSKDDWPKILDKITEYNERVRSRDLHRKNIPFITKRWIQTGIRRAFRPPRRERLRAANE